MELHVVDSEGIPEGCVLSIRAGSTRRQAPVSADRPFRFPTTSTDAMPFKVDVLEPVASARMILRPGEEQRTDCQYTIPLESTEASGDGAGASGKDAEAKKPSKEMSVTIAVAPADETAETAGDKDPEDESRPGTAKKRSSSGSNDSSSRHGQANAARVYLDKHNLVEFTQLLVQSVIKEQPDRPYAYMARQFYFPEPQPRQAAAESSSKPAAGSPTPAPANAAA
mmetsp:Transcript_52277/g.150554  ORF Transcript_52277/g.150554 Transcript_52277/m.150554 type:complete len:225 (-) Transcript_52277:39-713(-)